MDDETQYVYVAQYEIYDDYSCRGHDLYMSLEEDKVDLWLAHHTQEYESVDWLENSEMYFRPLGRYGWEKWYVIARPLDEEL
jgi:hypothetical protein